MKKVRIIGLAMALLSYAKVWSVCQYCTEYNSGNSPIQTCSAVGSGWCGNLYVYGRTACCSNTPGPACDLSTSPDTEYFIYRFTYGTCNGIYQCSQSTSYSCNGDFIVASSSGCAPYGNEYIEISTRLYCD